MSSLPTMPVGVDRYLADTAHLTLEEQGVHFRLQIYAWRSPGCCLPDDDARLARMLGITLKRWATLKPSVMALWTLNDGTWVNDQVAREHEFVTGKIEKKRAAGKLGGRPKSLPDNDEGKASGSENAKQNESEPKPATATATYTPIVPKGTQPDRFEEFRAAYPLRNVPFKPTQARKRWLEAIKRGEDPERIIAGAKSYAAEQARIGKAGTEFVKTPEVWLRNQLWLDYLPEASAAESKASGPDSYLAGLSDDDWRAHLRRWRSTGGQWTLANRTKPPDDPGTKVPAHLLAELGNVAPLARAG